MGASPTRDRELLGEIEELYRRRHPAFVRVALGLLGDRELAHDAVQESFARAIRARFEVREQQALEAWLWRTLTNHCRDLLRRRPHGPPAELTEAATSNGHPPELAELRAAVAALPDRQRVVLFLRHYADLDYRQIAAVLGIERGTVAATLHAARAALRSTIREGVA